MPSCAPRPVPTISAVGVASPSAHGQAMISTATAAVNATAGSTERPASDQRQQRDRRSTTGTNTAETRSASRCTGGLAGLGLLDQPGDLGQLGVGADPGGPDDQPTAGVDGGAGDRVARADLDRHRLAGEHARVDRGRAVDDLAVGGDLLAGPDDEPVADRESSRPGSASRRRPAAPRRPWRPSSQQRPQRGAGAPPRPRLRVPPGQQERGHPRRRLEVDRAGRVATLGQPAEPLGHAGLARRCRRPARRPTRGTRRACRSRSACPSSRRRAAGWTTRPGGTAGRPRATTGVASDQRHPLPAVELRGRHHRQHDHRHREHDRDDQATPPAQRVRSGSSGCGTRRACSRRPRRSRPGRPR